MQTPYCVIDATTLIENIHEIKKWVYNSQIRLVVPLSTSERVEHLYQKSIEQKPKPQEPARPKSSGKTTRKEHPTFDINPRLAKSFLAWLQCDDEDWDPDLTHAVEFQQANEVYTPWTLAEEHGDKRDRSPKKGPTTFAQAVAKANLVKQEPGNGDAAKGPAKPKLVARAPGSDRSPWKIGRKIPQIPLREVPVEVRPVLSYVLWRIHESDKGRADASSLVVLSDILKTHTTGQKLDIAVNKMEEIRSAVAAQVTETDRNTLGDLEREFGATGSCPKTLQNGLSHDSRQNLINSNGMQTLPADEEGVLNGGNMEDAILSHIADGKGEEKTNEKANDIEKHLENYLENSTLVDRATDGLVPQEAENENKSNNFPEQDYPTVVYIAENNSALEKDVLVDSTDPVSNEYVSEKISNITAWIKNLAPKLSSSPEPSLYSQQGTDGSTKIESISQQPVVLQRAAEVSTPSPRRTPSASPAPELPTEELEDSDEEVVVFNPKAKRLSAQQKPPPQSPKQNIASLVPHLAQSPKLNASQSPKSNVQRSLRKAPPIRQPQAKAPPVAPAIIDPDAFGRSFATNPRSDVHNNHPNSRYSPRGGSPGRAIRTPEPELDYVLKSGNTRASVRGKGKLWVP